MISSLAGSQALRLLGSLIVAIPLFALIAQLWPALHGVWTSSTAYSHGYAILALAIWLAVREFRLRPLGPARPSWAGLAAVTAVASVAVAANATDVQLLQEFAVPALLVTACWAVAGFDTAKRIAIPAGYLCFAMTVWDSLTEPLQALTTAVVGAATRFSSIPVHVVGNTIEIPSGTFEVEGGCSGLRYAIVALALAAFWGVTQYQRPAPRIALCLAGFGVALVANWVRVYLIVLAGHLTDMQHSWVTEDHSHVGWTVFLIMILPLFLFAHRFERAPRAADFGLARPSSSPTSVGPDDRSPRSVVPITGALLTCGVLLIAFSGSMRAPAGLAQPIEVALPEEIAGWQSAGSWQGPAVPSYRGADRLVVGRYKSGDAVVDVYAAGYLSQRQGAELIYYANRAVAVSDSVLGSRSLQVPVDDGGRKSLPVRQLLVKQQDGSRRLVWVIYSIAGFTTHRDPLAKLYQVLGALRGRQDAQALVMSTTCAKDCSDAERVLEHFARRGAQSLLTLVQPAARAQ